MQICAPVVYIVKKVVTTVIAIIKSVVQVVCGWVTTILHHAKKVCNKVCSWLGPFESLCKLVCKVVEWTEKIVEWVCEQVIVKIIEFVEAVVEYLFYLVYWVCWIVDWILVRWWLYLLCRFGVTDDTRYIHVCVRVLEQDRRNPAWDMAEVERLLDEANARFERCGIRLCVRDIQVIVTENHRTGIACGGAKGFFSGDHVWFSKHECSPFGPIIPITIYLVDDIVDAKGCAIPGSNYILIDHGTSDSTIPHEIGHLSSLTHSDDEANIMFEDETSRSVNITKHQCCMIRTSKYATLRGCERLAPVIG